jgi:hypothetical protein
VLINVLDGREVVESFVGPFDPPICHVTVMREKKSQSFMYLQQYGHSIELISVIRGEPARAILCEDSPTRLGQSQYAQLVAGSQLPMVKQHQEHFRQSVTGKVDPRNGLFHNDSSIATSND